MRRPTDPFGASVAALGALGAAGLVALVLAWRGVAAEVRVPTQVSFLVSGGIGGLALIGFAFGLLIIQSRRLGEARRRARFDDVIEAAAALLATAREQEGGQR